MRVGQVWHEGLVSDRRDLDGLPFVISKSKRARRVEEEPWRIFAPRDLRAIVIGYPGKLPPAEVLARARARIGEPWTLTQNCQRFTRAAHGVAARSPGLEQAAILIGGFVGAFGRLART